MSCTKHRVNAAVALLFVAMSPAVRAKAPDAATTIAAGTEIVVRMKSKLRSDVAKPGDQFRGKLETPITGNGRVLYRKGTDVAGYVVRAHASQRFTDPGVLELDLISIGDGMEIAAVNARTLVIKGEVHKKPDPAGNGVATLMPISGSGKKDSLVDSDAVLAWVAVAPGAARVWSSNPPGDVRRGVGTPFRIIRRTETEAAEKDDQAYRFSDRDRRAIRKCIAARPDGRDKRSPELDRQLQPNGTLSAGLQKRARPLPSACAQQLQPVPRQWARVVLSGHVMLLDPGSRIVDIFVF